MSSRRQKTQSKVFKQTARQKGKTLSKFEDSKPNTPTSEGLNLLSTLVSQQRQMADSFTNVAARTGIGSSSLINGSEYSMNRLTQNYALLNTLYRDSWIIARVIDVLAEDMTKKGFSIQSDMGIDEQTRIFSGVKKTKTLSSLKEGLKWGNLYGGALGLIILEGQDDLSEPINYDLILPGSYKGLMIIDRWDGVSPSSELVQDLSDPDRGLPEYYTISSQETNGMAGSSLRVHHSRVLRFIGRELPAVERRTEMYWGGSILEPILEELLKRDNTSANIAALIFQANLKVFGIDEFGSDMGMASESTRKEMYDTVTAMNTLMSSQGIMLMGKEDQFETKQYSFSGLSDVYELFMLDISGATGIPATILFGREPAGMNATGESDLQIYYDKISTDQESKLEPLINRLLKILCLSTIGYFPEDIEITFNPIRTMSDESKMELLGKGLTSITTAFQSGVWDKAQALQASKELGENVGMFQFISDEDIEKEKLAGSQEESSALALLQGALNPILPPTPNLSFGDSSPTIFEDAEPEWDESDHPRGEDGKFIKGSGSTSTIKNNPPETIARLSKSLGSAYRPTSAQKKALDVYTGTFTEEGFQGGSQKINNTLRAMEGLDKETSRVVTNLRSSMEKSQLPEDITVFRGMTPATFGLPEYSKLNEEEAKALEGQVVQSRSFTSTSLDKGFVDDYFDHNISMVLKVPKGTKYAYSNLMDSQEVVLPIGMKYKVTKVNYLGNGMVDLEAEVIPRGA